VLPRTKAFQADEIVGAHLPHEGRPSWMTPGLRAPMHGPNGGVAESLAGARDSALDEAKAGVPGEV
jgi:hypothetical protein